MSNDVVLEKMEITGIFPFIIRYIQLICLGYIMRKDDRENLTHTGHIGKRK